MYKIPALLVGIAAVAAVWFWFGGNTTTPSTPAISPGTNHYLGNPNAKVKIEELIDYECKGCADYEKINKQIIKKYGDNIAFYVRSYPIDTHQGAFSAAEAAEAAGSQGKFWEMHDLLLQNQDEWTKSSAPADFYVKYARKLGLNTEDFKKALKNNTHKKSIEQDKTYGETYKPDAIPSIVINGKNEGYLKDEGLFAEKIDQALKQEAPTPAPVAKKGDSLLNFQTVWGILMSRFFDKPKTPEPVCISLCKEGDCLCEVADIAITVHGEKPGEREELNQSLNDLRKFKYAPMQGGLSFLGKKLLDRAIDDIQELSKQAEKIGRKLTGVDVYVTVSSFPCTSVDCGNTKKWIWGEGKTKQVMVPPPKDCKNKYVPDAWDEKCLLDKGQDFEGYITREAKKSCPACK